MKKSIIFSLFIFICICMLVGCSFQKEFKSIENTLFNNETSENDQVSEKKLDYIQPEGKTLQERIAPPLNFTRTSYNENSFAHFIRNLPVKKDGSPVLLYNGKKKNNQSAHVAVFDISVGKKDLQQCADSIIRMYAEYHWSIKEYDKISFHLTNNFQMEYTKWRDGNRLIVEGNDTYWKLTDEYDDSYENFLKYLETVFMYAGTLSLDSEAKNIKLSEIEAGDIFIEAGSPGHCVLVVDMAENKQGEKAFLLAQGYMPAQEFHVLANPLHKEDPWYYLSEVSFPLKTPQWTFKEGSLKRR